MPSRSLVGADHKEFHQMGRDYNDLWEGREKLCEREADEERGREVCVCGVGCVCVCVCGGGGGGGGF